MEKGAEATPLLVSKAAPSLSSKRASTGSLLERQSSKVLFLVFIFGLAFLWHILIGPVEISDIRRIGDYLPSRGASSKDDCPQVAPLLPGRRNEDLQRMDEYLTSDNFRNASVSRLSGLVQIPSMSYDDLGPVGEDERWEIFYQVANYLKTTYPLVHRHLALEKVNTHGLAYTWQGSNTTLKPLLLMAHQDVVPVPEDTLSAWTHPPFSGHYDGKLVWGRGSSDCKNSLTAILEAIEQLLATGFAPSRTVVLAFGFDEEISGHQGAAQLAPFLQQKYGGGRDGFAAILDEGAGPATLWGTAFFQPGVAEKGYLDVEIVVRVPGGHSSVPPEHGGIGIMAEVVRAVEGAKYAPRLLEENPYLGLMKCGARYSEGFPERLRKLLGRRGGRGKSVGKGKGKEQEDEDEDKLAVEASKEGLVVKYMMTTSLAVDVIRGGVKANALPERTQVTVNHRINVGETTAAVKEKLTHLAGIVAHRFNLTVHAFDDDDDNEEDREAEPLNSIILRARGNALEPAPVTPTTIDPVSPYTVISGTTRALYGDHMIMAPGLMPGNTDTRYYWDLSRHIFRLAPGYDPEHEGFGNIHTVNEAISVKNHVQTVRWYSLFIRNMDESALA